MRDAAFVKACELVVEFRKQASHWKKLLFATSDELSAARHALSDIAKHCGLKSWTIPQLVESVGLALAEDPAALQEALSKMTKERDAQSALVAKQRHLLAAKQTEIGALEAERDEMKEEIKQANKEASDATARQRMTEVRALKYSAQAEDARREIERLRSEVESLRAKLNDAIADLVAERDALRAQLATERERKKTEPDQRSHPVKVGEWVERTGLPFRGSPIGQKAQVTEVRHRTTCTYKMSCGRIWDCEFCTPCDPPEATHDTPDGKQVAEAHLQQIRSSLEESVSADQTGGAA